MRYPHYAFGGFASYVMGWITWLAAAVVAPIEVEGTLQYATKYYPFTVEHPGGKESIHTLTALTFKDAFGPLAAIAGILGLTWLAVLLYADAIVSPGDTGLIYTAITSRLGYAMAHNGNVPRPASRLTRTGVPWVATIVAFVVGLAIFLPFPSWQQLVGLVTGATVLSFGSGPLVFAALRREMPDHPRAFRLPGGDLIPFLAFLSSNMIVFWAGWATNWKLFVAVLIGMVLLGVFTLIRSVHLPHLNWKAGSWVLPWLGGLALISYLSDYDGIGVIGLGWGFVVNFGFSALIYAWALRVRLHGEHVQEIIETTPHDEVAHEAEPGDAGVGATAGIARAGVRAAGAGGNATGGGRVDTITRTVPRQRTGPDRS